MKILLAEASYYLILIAGYIWGVLQIISGEPFDGGLMILITYYLHMYRNAIRRELEGIL